MSGSGAERGDETDSKGLRFLSLPGTVIIRRRRRGVPWNYPRALISKRESRRTWAEVGRARAQFDNRIPSFSTPPPASLTCPPPFLLLSTDNSPPSRRARCPRRWGSGSRPRPSRRFLFRRRLQRRRLRLCVKEGRLKSTAPMAAAPLFLFLPPLFLLFLLLLLLPRCPSSSSTASSSTAAQPRGHPGNP